MGRPEYRAGVIDLGMAADAVAAEHARKGIGICLGGFGGLANAFGRNRVAGFVVTAAAPVLAQPSRKRAAPIFDNEDGSAANTLHKDLIFNNERRGHTGVQGLQTGGMREVV